MSSGQAQQGDVRISEKDFARLGNLLRKPDTPWWRNYPLMISAAAFSLSLVTSLIAARTSYVKDIHEQQAQLATTMQAMADLTIKQAEVTEKYKGTAYEMPISNLLISHANTLMHTANGLALRLGTNATTAELVTIAGAFAQAGSVAGAKQLLVLALAAAQNAFDESIALRLMGDLEIRNANSPESRKAAEEYFRRAANVDRGYGNLSQNPYAVLFLKATAEFAWADALAFVDCAEAQIHFANGMSVLLAAQRTPENDQMRRVADSRYSGGIGGMPTCRPLATPVPSQ